MAAPESPEAVLESLVGRIADEFTGRHQRGEGPRLEEYTERYPELAELLREILPAIQALGPARGQALAETPGPCATPGRAAAVSPPSGLVDYEILAEIGRGGMGVVYKARHRTLGRIVALKVLRSTDTVDLERFRREAQAVARLQHPNVVQIFDVQEANGQPFLALEFVEGGSLASRIKGEPQPPREAAALVELLARGIAAAHESGLVHRDLKPSNVLLSRSSTDFTDSADLKNGVVPSSESVKSAQSVDSFVPKITDFGLVKRIDQDLGPTQTGAIVGTPSYMAPEQAVGGASVGPAADLFALGAILYELIAGRPPFKGPSILETLELVRHAEPTPPSRLQPGCPRDLETICLKCLHKEPTHRYGSAALLADDLQRFLKGEPIHARPVGKVERLGKWLRRRPALAASIALGALAALALVALAVRLLYSWELEHANQKLGEAVGSREAALVVAQDARRVAEKNHQEANEARAKLDSALERERDLHYVHSIGLAQREWQANRVDEARRILDACPQDLRHWEWHYLHRQCHVELATMRGHVGGVQALAVSPNGKLVVAASTVLGQTVKQDLKIWDAASGKLAGELVGHTSLVHGVAFSPDGTILVSAGNDKTIRFWDPRDGREVRRILGKAAFGQIAFSPNGTRLAASAGLEIHVFDAAGGDRLFSLSGHTQIVHALAFSADGQRLVSGGNDRLVKLWDLAAKKEVFSSSGHTGLIRQVAFSPQQDQIISCAGGSAGTVRGEVCIWNAKDGKQTPPTMTFPFPVTAATFTADGAQIACGADEGRIFFLDARTGRTNFILRGHEGVVNRLVFTADGSRLVTGSVDRTLRVWHVLNPEFAQVPGSFPTVTSLAFSVDGRLAFCNYLASLGGRPQPVSLRVLPAPPATDMLELKPAKPILAWAFATDRRLFAADEGAVHLWDLDKANVRFSIAEVGVVDMSISPDGQRLATATRNPAVNLRPDFSHLQTLSNPFPNPPPPPVPAIKIWGATTGKLERILPGQISVAFSPDGQRLAGAQDHSVRVWDVATGNALRTLVGPTDPVLKVQFVAQGRQVIGFTHRQATVWNAETGAVIATVDGLKGPAFATPDGRRIVSIHEGHLKWWDVRTGRELLLLTVPETSLGQLTLSADGHRLAAFGVTKVCVWDTLE